MRLPEEHPIATFREWAKIVVPAFALIAAIAAALAAWKQLGLAQASSERQDRAYVLVETSQLMDFSAGRQTVARIDVKNFGRTPAFDYEHVGRCRLVQFPSSFGPFDPPADVFRSKSVLAPNAGTTGFFRCPPLSDLDIEALGSGLKALFIDGRILYRDTFGKERRTLYKRMVGGSAGVRGDGIAHSLEGDDAN